MEERSNDPSLRDYLAVVYGRKFLVLAVCLVTTVAVALGSYLTPPTYTATTALIVKFGREFIYRPEVGGRESSKTFTLGEMVNSEVEILASRDLARSVVEELGIDRFYPKIAAEEPDAELRLAKAVASFQAAVSINAVFESSIIRVAFVHSDPRVAAEALNVLVERFKDKHLEIFGESKSGFLEAQLEKYHQQLEKAENALQKFKREKGVFELTAQKAAMLAQRVELETELRMARFRIAELEEDRKALEGDSSEVLAKLQPNPILEQQRAGLISKRVELASLLKEADLRIVELTRSLARFSDSRKGSGQDPAPTPGVERFRSLDEAFIRLLDLEIRERELIHDYKEGSREVTALHEEIDIVKRFLKDRGAYVEKVLEGGVREELSSLSARKKALEEQIDEINTELGALASRERSLRENAISTELAALSRRETGLVREIDRLVSEVVELDSRAKVLRQLEREVTVSDRSYQNYLDRYEQAKSTAELDEQRLVNLTVIETAAPPIAPNGLPKHLKIALGLIAGLVAGIALAFFLELLAA